MKTRSLPLSPQSKKIKGPGSMQRMSELEYDNIKTERGEISTDSHTKFIDGYKNGRKDGDL
jgi:hypothetical protein